MKLVIRAIGRLKTSHEAALVAHYLTRASDLARSQGFRGPHCEELAEGRPPRAADSEAERLVTGCNAAALCIALDEGGVQPGSREIATRLAVARDASRAEAIFILGGAGGHGTAVRARADETWSLGAITLPHGLARVVLAEQLYRAMTILAGHPYHRD